MTTATSRKPLTDEQKAKKAKNASYMRERRAAAKARANGFAAQAESDTMYAPAAADFAADRVLPADSTESTPAVCPVDDPVACAAHDEQAADGVDADADDLPIHSLDHTTAWITPAPEAYDGFGTWTQQRGLDGMRVVRIHDDHLGWQRTRYLSGGFACAPAVPVDAEPVATVRQNPEWFDSALGRLTPLALALLRSLLESQNGGGCFVDQLAIPADTRMAEVRSALDALEQATLVMQSGGGAATHSLRPTSMVSRHWQDGELVLPPAVDPAKVSPARIARQPRQDAHRQAYPAGTLLGHTFKGKHVVCRVLADGYEVDGVIYGSLSAAASAVAGNSRNGHLFWNPV